MSAIVKLREDWRTVDLPRTCKPPGGWVYILDYDHGVKIGTTGHLRTRMRDFERAFGGRPMLLATFAFEDPRHAYAVEQHAHWRLRRDKTYGEWFHCHPLDAVATVRACLEYTRPPSRMTPEEVSSAQAHYSLGLARRVA